jgi:hypothetical protein
MSFGIFGRMAVWETAEMPYKHRLLLNMGEAETRLLDICNSELRFTLVEHHSVGHLLFPHVGDIAAQVSYALQTEGLKREDFGQNMGVFRGVYQGPNGCLWLVSSRLPWQGQGDMYFIQRQAQAMKRLCGPLATQLARALGKPIDYAAEGVPGDTEAILALVMKGGRDILAFHSKWNKFIFVSKAGNHGVVSMYNAADETLGHFEALVPENRLSSPHCRTEERYCWRGRT